jgi:hypothetical protein
MVFAESQAHCVHIFESSTPKPLRVTLRNNIVHNCGLGGSGDSSSAIVMNGTNHLIYNNILYALLAHGINTAPSTAVSGLGIYHNTIHGTGSVHSAIANNSGQTGMVISNNLIYQANKNIDNLASGTVFQTNFCTTLTTGCEFSGDPLFVNPAGRNYSLQATSPALNAGTTIAAVTTDFLGVTRPQGTAYDIGAYERLGGDTTPPAAPTGLTVQ